MGRLTCALLGVALCLPLALPVEAAGPWEKHSWWDKHPGRDDHPAGRAPWFEVDPAWPKPLPNNWLLGQVAGIAVDRHDKIWIIQRPRSLTSDEAAALGQFEDATNEQGVPISALGHPRPFGPLAECCEPAPAVMQFDANGNLLRAWGGPADPGFLDGPTPRCRESEGCVWPAGEHGIFVDHNDFVYIAGNGTGNGAFPWDGTHGADSHLLKFSADGTFLLRIGDPGATAADSNDTNSAINNTPQLYRPADMEVDPKTNELYIADGYGNRRIVVVDAASGLYKRHWGAYGQRPVDDAATEAAGPYGAADRDAAIIPYFRNPVHCVRITHDNLVYVCDRVNDRIQVFTKNAGSADCQNLLGQSGECGFVAEKFIRRETLLNGTVWDLDTSSDRRETCLHNADGSNQYVDTLNRRTLELLDSFGRNGRYAGEFHWVHNLATDSHGNIYTAEVDTGKRAQKFDRHGPRGCR